MSVYYLSNSMWGTICPGKSRNVSTNYLIDLWFPSTFGNWKKLLDLMTRPNFIVKTSPVIFSYRIAICDSKTWNCDSFLKSWCKTAIEVLVRYPKSSSEVLNVKFSCATRTNIFPLYYHTKVKVSQKHTWQNGVFQCQKSMNWLNFCSLQFKINLVLGLKK